MVTKDQGTHYVQGYTALLMGFGLLLVIGAVTLHSVAELEEDAWALLLVRNLEIVMAAGVLLVAVLRVRTSAFAEPATTAASWILAIWVPLGAVAFIWWFVSVRKREDPALRPAETSE